MHVYSLILHGFRGYVNTNLHESRGKFFRTASGSLGRACRKPKIKSVLEACGILACVMRYLQGSKSPECGEFVGLAVSYPSTREDA